MPGGLIRWALTHIFYKQAYFCFACQVRREVYETSHYRSLATVGSMRQAEAVPYVPVARPRCEWTTVTRCACRGWSVVTMYLLAMVVACSAGASSQHSGFAKCMPGSMSAGARDLNLAVIIACLPMGVAANMRPTDPCTRLFYLPRNNILVDHRRSAAVSYTHLTLPTILRV